MIDFVIVLGAAIGSVILGLLVAAALHFIESRESSACFCGEGLVGPGGTFCSDCGRPLCEMCAIYDAEWLCPVCYAQSRIGGHEDVRQI